jgi:hypothetical protein
MDQFYGTDLIFKTFRVGFPTAKVTVIDNASLDEAKGKIQELTESIGGEYLQINTRDIPHYAIVKHILINANGETVILDPDIAFKSNCENIGKRGLVGGRYMREFFDPYSQRITHPRLHSSFLVVRSAEELREDWKDKVQVQRPISCVSVF